MTAGQGEVFDLGYQGYEGERTGSWARRRAIWRDGVRISLGLGRSTGDKFVSWILIGLAVIPVLVLAVVAAFVSTASDFKLPSYAEYYHWEIVPLALFAAVVAPLLICPDRRDRVLSLYAARPITALDYVGSRWAAFLAVSTAVAWLPPAILFVSNLLDATSPGTFLGDNWDVVPRFLAAGATVALALTTLALLASSFATRRAYASVSILAVIFVGSAIGGISESFTGTVAHVLSLASLPADVVDSVHWIFGQPLPNRPLAGWVPLLWLLALTVAMGAGLLVRTRKLVRG